MPLSPSTRCAWGGATASTPPSSLADVMSEELARKLTSDEVSSATLVAMTETLTETLTERHVDDAMDDDLALAIRLSLEESERCSELQIYTNSNTINNNCPISYSNNDDLMNNLSRVSMVGGKLLSSSEDEDRVLALALQLEEDESAASLMSFPAIPTAHIVDPYVKIRVASSLSPSLSPALLSRKARSEDMLNKGSGDDSSDSSDTMYPDDQCHMNMLDYTKLPTGPMKSQSSSTTLHNRVFQDLRGHAKSMDKRRIRVKEKRVDRATGERVLDQHTRLILHKWMGTGLVKTMNGVISAGKEANVYRCVAGIGEEAAGSIPQQHYQRRIQGTLAAAVPLPNTFEFYACKIFRTTLNAFSNRSTYIAGEWRFRHRKMFNHDVKKFISIWAEKELKNLYRIYRSGIRCPAPVRLRDHCLLMEYIEDGSLNRGAAPSLAQAQRLGMLSHSRILRLYSDCAVIMRHLYHRASLVHADLSEFNLLLTDSLSTIVVIDVAQAVDTSHVLALDFLKRDCVNITNFFHRRAGLLWSDVLTPRGLFDYILHDTLPKPCDVRGETGEIGEIGESSDILMKSGICHVDRDYFYTLLQQRSEWVLANQGEVLDLGVSHFEENEVPLIPNAKLVIADEVLVSLETDMNETSRLERTSNEERNVCESMSCAPPQSLKQLDVSTEALNFYIERGGIDE